MLWFSTKTLNHMSHLESQIFTALNWIKGVPWINLFTARETGAQRAERIYPESHSLSRAELRTEHISYSQSEHFPLHHICFLYSFTLSSLRPELKCSDGFSQHNLQMTIFSALLCLGTTFLSPNLKNNVFVKLLGFVVESGTDV